MHPPGPFPLAHLDACHEDPALEPPRWRARAQLFTRPAADAGPWRRAARALPACERGKGRRRGWGGGGSGQGRRHGVAAGGSAWGAPRAAWGCVGWSWGRGPCGWGKGVEGRWRGRLYQPSSLGIAGPFPGPWRPVLGGRGVPGDGAWHWGVRAPDTVSTPPIGSARALSSGASHPAPSPWVELGSTQGVVWCGVVCCVVLCCVVLCCVVLCCVVLCCVVLCCVVLCDPAPYFRPVHSRKLFPRPRHAQPHHVHSGSTTSDAVSSSANARTRTCPTPSSTSRSTPTASTWRTLPRASTS